MKTTPLPAGPVKVLVCLGTMIALLPAAQAQSFAFHAYHDPVSLTFTPGGVGSGTVANWNGGEAWVPWGFGAPSGADAFVATITADPGFVLTGWGVGFEDVGYSTIPFGGYFHLQYSVAVSASSIPGIQSWNYDWDFPYEWSGGARDFISGPSQTISPTHSVSFSVDNRVQIQGSIGGYYTFWVGYAPLSSVPEPELTAAATALALGGAAIVLRRRKALR